MNFFSPLGSLCVPFSGIFFSKCLCVEVAFKLIAFQRLLRPGNGVQVDFLLISFSLFYLVCYALPAHVY
jgi:hypothetical protein